MNTMNRKISKKDQELQKLILNNLEEFIEKLVKNYIKKHDIEFNDVVEQRLLVKKKIYDKLLCICICLFFNKREKFFKLLRKDIAVDR